MFFSRKGDKRVQTAAQTLADYYSLSVEETSKWCDTDGNSIAITLPFCALTQHGALRDVLTAALDKAGHANTAIAINQKIVGAKTA